jgi:SagB-type dehydrogenase family enzyme
MQDGPGPEFIEKTRSKNATPSQQSQGMPQPPLEIAPHPGRRVVDLPSPAGIQIPAFDLRLGIEQRRSSRHYSAQPLTLEELSLLLWMTQGVKEVTKRPATLRTVPSAGARHSFETYLTANRVDGLPAGLYRFLAIEHQLEEIECDPGFIDRFGETCWKQQQVLSSGVTFVWAAVRARMYWRYGERGYRYLFLDAGHVCQNLYLAGEALNCGVCAIGAFDDDAIDRLLGLDGEEQFVIYAASVGKKS